MRTRRDITVFVALVAALLVPRSARSQDAGAAAPAWGQDRGFSVGLRFLVDGLGADRSDNPLSPVIDDIGSGLVLSGGYTFTPRFHVRATLGAANHATDIPGLDVQRSVATVEGHYRFLPDRQVCPYLFGSLGGTTAIADHGIDHLKLTGGMAGIGAGMLVGLTRRFSMDVTGRIDGVNWNRAEWSQDQPGGGTLKYEDPIEESGSSARLEIGFLWSF